ncbi:MAG: flippase-like domain-containing protein [Planctomycetota bacterium]|nr:flippase-like domain-containing protein [Planctomycetota bacterium]
MAGDVSRRSPSSRKRLWSIFKWSLTLLVLAFVAVRAKRLWDEGTAGGVELHAGWLVLSGLLYALGWLPSAWYYKAILSRMGDEIAWRPILRAYYCGLLGKYVPGKALVPIIRGRMVAAAGGRFRAGALAVVYDSVVFMGVGVEVSVALLAFLIPKDLEKAPKLFRLFAEHPWGQWVLDHPIVLPISVLIVVVASLPVVGRLFAFVAAKLAPVGDDQTLTRRIDASLIGQGFLVFSAAWFVHGLSLWAVLRGVGANAALSDLPTWTACIALPMTAGFIALFAPGGVGVREGVLIEVLKAQPGIDPRQAVAAAFALRLVGLLTEVLVAVVLYYGLAPRPDRGANVSSEV